MKHQHIQFSTAPRMCQPKRLNPTWVQFVICADTRSQNSVTAGQKQPVDLNPISDKFRHLGVACIQFAQAIPTSATFIIAAPYQVNWPILATCTSINAAQLKWVRNRQAFGISKRFRPGRPVPSLQLLVNNNS